MTSHQGHADLPISDELMTAIVQALNDPSTTTDDRRDIKLVAARMLTTGPERYVLDEVLNHVGVTREQLTAMPD